MTTPEQFIEWVKQILNIRKTPAVEKAAGILGVTRLTIFRWLNGTMPPSKTASLLMDRIIRDNTDWLPERAAAFARRAHEGQTRKFTGAPYYTHVERVAALVRERTDRTELIAAAYLHDTMEDCGVTYETLAQHFGHAVANIVHALTNDNARKKQQGKVRYMIDKLTAMNPDALLVKLCDILNNISETHSANQARNYILIMDGLLSKPPLVWNHTHADLVAQILAAYRQNWS